MIQSVTFLGILGVLSYEDLKKREVTTWVVLFAGIVGILYHLLFWENTIYSLLLGVIPGFAALLLSYLTEESIGMGDSLVLCVAGLFLGGSKVCVLIVTSFILCGLFGLLALVIFRKGRKWEIPFLPFLFCAYAGMLAAQWGGV